MKNTLTIALIGLFLVSYCFADTTIAPVKVIPPHEPTIKELIAIYANKYDVSESMMHKVIKCESEYKPKALGDNGHARGLVQINDIWHPEVSKSDAYNPEFAIEFLAKGLANGNGHEWSCYRKLT